MLDFTWVLIRGVAMYDCFYAGTLFKSEIMQNGKSFTNGKLESSFVTLDKVGDEI